MTMTAHQIRAALRTLRGDRTARFTLEGAVDPVTVNNAFLVPEEADQLIKLTDGTREFVLDADRIVWIELMGQSGGGISPATMATPLPTRTSSASSTTATQSTQPPHHHQ